MKCCSAKASPCRRIILRPDPASDRDICVSTLMDWVTKLKTGSSPPVDVMPAGNVRIRRNSSEAVWLLPGGTILSRAISASRRMRFKSQRGFHHAYPGHGEGFCRGFTMWPWRFENCRGWLLGKEGCCRRHGTFTRKSTAAYFRNHPTVFTISDFYQGITIIQRTSRHQAYDLHMADRADDDEYWAC